MAMGQMRVSGKEVRVDTINCAFEIPGSAFTLENVQNLMWYIFKIGDLRHPITVL